MYLTQVTIATITIGLCVTSTSGSFQYSRLVIKPARIQIEKLLNVTVTFEITNTGQRDGEEITEMYISWENSPASYPVYQLVGFKRYRIKHGTSVSGNLIISPDKMAAFVDGKGFTVKPGTINVYVGPSMSTFLNGTFVIDGSVSSSGLTRMELKTTAVLQLSVLFLLYI